MSLSGQQLGRARKNAPLLLLLLALPLSLLTHCTESNTGQCVTGCDYGGQSGGPALSGGGGSSGGPSSGSGGQSIAGSPSVPCGSTMDCALPRSICSGTMLTYYDGGLCVDGLCRWQQVDMYCPGGCMNGGCMLSSTTATSFPPIPQGGAASGEGGQAGAAGFAGQEQAGAPTCWSEAGAGGQSQCDAP